MPKQSRRRVLTGNRRREPDRQPSKVIRKGNIDVLDGVTRSQSKKYLELPRLYRVHLNLIDLTWAITSPKPLGGV